MIKGKKVLAIIPARGGSKGVPGKNIRAIGGKPLVAWTIEAATASRYIDRLILSSDDDDIIRLAKTYGCEVPFRRPAELATDDASTVDTVLHAVDNIEEKYDLLVLLQVTSPLRTTVDIDCCIELYAQTQASSVVSVTETEKSPYWMYTIDEQSYLAPLLANDELPQRRQDAPKVYLLNGAIYVIGVEKFLESKSFVLDKTQAYEMPKERSIDIDTESDIVAFEELIN